MTSRERVRRAIEFGSPDRVPLWPRCEGTAWLKHGQTLYELLRSYPLDLGMPEKLPSSTKQELSWVDEWSCHWHRERPGLFGAVDEHPLADRDAMTTYEFPDFSRPEFDSRFAKILEPFERRDHSRYAIVEGATEYGVLWYRMWWLRGMENALADTALEDGFIEELRDRIIDTQLSYLHRVLPADVDGISFGDDWGTQETLMVAPERWREVFKPAYRRLFDTVHAAGKHVIMETDGCTKEILADWAETGVDLLSVQLNAVGLENVTGQKGRICFYADPDRQKILPRGTPDEVESHVRDIVAALKAPTGGLVGCLYVTDETPLPNVRAALDAFLRYGSNEQDDGA